METIGFKKLRPALYRRPANHFALIEVPAMQFVMAGSTGNPNTTPAYKQAIEWLFSVSYAMKSTAKSGKTEPSKLKTILRQPVKKT